MFLTLNHAGFECVSAGGTTCTVKTQEVSRIAN